MVRGTSAREKRDSSVAMVHKAQASAAISPTELSPRLLAFSLLPKLRFHSCCRNLRSLLSQEDSAGNS